jgi:hypothetical protein
VHGKISCEGVDASGVPSSVQEEVRGVWNTMGLLKIVYSGGVRSKEDRGVGSVLYSGMVYSGSVVQEDGETRVRGSVDGVGEFVWQLQLEGNLQQRDGAGGQAHTHTHTAMRTSAMAFLESYYKQRCELKLCGARVKRRSLLQVCVCVCVCVFVCVDQEWPAMPLCVCMLYAYVCQYSESKCTVFYSFPALVAACVCVCVCVCICVYLYMYVHVYIRIYIHA